MEQIISYIRNLYKLGKISNMDINLDTDYNPKTQFVIKTALDEEEGENKVHREYVFFCCVSNYRFQVSTNEISKDTQLLYENVFGQFVMREPRSKCCIFLENKNWMPDLDFVKQVLEFLMDPKTNPKITMMKRNYSSMKF